MLLSGKYNLPETGRSTFVLSLFILITVVEIFKTNIDSRRTARNIVNYLETHFPHCKVNVDLDDCDKILRVEALSLDGDKIMETVKNKGVTIAVLEE